jgi:hypothetical protein
MLWPIRAAMVGIIACGLLGWKTASAKTNVRLEGTTVIIHVPIEIGVGDPGTFGYRNTQTGEFIPAAKLWKEKIEQIFNDAFKGFVWKDCLTFKLELEIMLVPRGMKAKEGHHSVEWDPKKGRSFWWPTGPDDTVSDRDFPYAYSRDMSGFFSTDNPNVLAHEVWHAMGGGDDYFETGGYKPEAAGIGERAGGVVLLDSEGFSGSGSFGTRGAGGPEAVHLARLVQQMKDAGVLPQCWKGKLRANARGNIYNDTADVEFNFLQTADGAVSGNGRARMSHAPQTMSGGCVYTRAQTPEEFDVKVTGKRAGDHFELDLTASTTATYRISAKCPSGVYTSSIASMAALMGGIDVVLHPAKVPIRDGSTRLHHTITAAWEATGEIEIQRKE